MVKIHKNELFDVWFAQKNRSRKHLEPLYEHVRKISGTESIVLSDSSEKELNDKLRNLVFRFEQLYKNHSRMSKRVKEAISKLNEDQQYLEFEVTSAAPEISSPNSPQEPSPGTSSSGSKRGRRPSADFDNLNRSTKWRRTNSPLTKYSEDELLLASRRKLLENKKPSAAKVLKLTEESPTKADKFLNALKVTNESKKASTLSPESALALMVRTKESVRSYLEHKYEADEHNHKLYPSYHKVLQAKKECYPSDDHMKITDSAAEVDLTQLIHHTYRRIFQIYSDDLESQDFWPDISHFITESKIGSDGTTGLSNYKFVSNDPTADGCCCFISNFVPLKLYAVLKSKQKRLIWKNPKPASTRFCRPFKMIFEKEKSDIVLREAELIENMIKSIPDLSVDFGEKSFTVIFRKNDIRYSMIDGKVANLLTETASNSTCRVCGATPKLLNNIPELVKLQIYTEALKYGFSPMHARIRFCDLVLHVSYKNKAGIRKYAVKLSEEEKHDVKAKKSEIQTEFKKCLGLRMDYPNPGGSGNSTDGNSARNFFQKSSRNSQNNRIRY